MEVEVRVQLKMNCLLKAIEIAMSSSSPIKVDDVLKEAKKFEDFILG